MANPYEQKQPADTLTHQDKSIEQGPKQQIDTEHGAKGSESPTQTLAGETTPRVVTATEAPLTPPEKQSSAESRPVERSKVPGRTGARGTAAMDAKTRQEVARKGGLAVSRNKQHMAEIGRKGGQSVSKNREHMALIGRKGGAASRGHR